jgi:hypothetical protein
MGMPKITFTFSFLAIYNFNFNCLFFVIVFMKDKKSYALNGRRLLVLCNTESYNSVDSSGRRIFFFCTK